VETGTGLDEHGDLSLAPGSYPGTPVAAPTLLMPTCRHLIRPRRNRPLLQAVTVPCARCAVPEGGHSSLAGALGGAGVAPMEQRTAVVAVGSNASPAVMRHKLGSRGVSVVVPMVTGILHNVAVGHSAHVARGGYVPAAPMHSSGALSRVVVQFLDPEQLAAVDATEPNYERVQLAPGRHPVVLSGGRRPARSWIYASRRGVLRRADLGPTLLTQADLLARLGTASLPELLADLRAPDGLSERRRRPPRSRRRRAP
jgi:hypothetical protein